jgi:lysine 2,3-aminomutase
LTNATATSVCPTYCTFCTRSYAVGADTDTVPKASLKPTRRRWEQVFAYIESQPQLQDIVVSGGDAYYLQPDQLRLIGERLISIPHIRRFRFASKGLAVAPGRVLDDGTDGWVDALIDVSNKARRAGKMMAWHTHFNHPNEISWVSEAACRRLFEEGVLVRNQTVLLRGVNDNVGTMAKLIRALADNNILPVSFACLVEKKKRGGADLTETGSTTSTSATWSRAWSICARRCRPSSTSRQRFAGRSPAS